MRGKKWWCSIVTCVEGLAVVVILCSCQLCDSHIEEGDSLRVAAWNVQNLFDGVSDGNEYYEYDPEKSIWNQAAYHERLKRAGQVLALLDADIIVLQEIEHEGVLEDICNWYIDHPGPLYYAAVTDEEAAVGVGLISRYPIADITSHRATLGLYDQQRSMLKAVVAAGGQTITCFVVHWKSRREGVVETEAARRASSLLLRRLIEEETTRYPDRLILAAGDFNTSIQDTPTEIPANRRALSEVADAQVVTLSGKPAEVAGSVLYDFWMDRQLVSDPSGSYWYDDAWLQLDHIAGSRHLFDGRGYDLASCQVFSSDVLVTAEGIPDRWSRYRGTGISDHLPVVMELEKAAD
ncbi:MAG: endonuclease/exonuclease/phosphatase family protein [Spirochaetota bacterium]